MSLGPILPGRIPDTFSVLRTQRNLDTSARQLSTLQQQLATGQQFFFGSEAPSDAIKTVRYQSLAERKTQAFRNTETGLSILSAADNALAEISNVLNSAKSISLGTIGDTATQTERDQYVTELDTLIDAAIQAANREFRGRKLFSGTQGNATPFALEAGGVGYFGDAQSTSSFGDLGQEVLTGINPASAFQTDVSQTSIDLNPAVTAATKLRDLHGGAGVSGTRLQIETTARTAEIDLSGAETLGDVALRIEQAFAADAVTVTATVTATGLTLTPSAGTIQATNITGDRLASDLGLTGPAVANLVGDDLNPKVSLTTPIADLLGGTGIASLADGLELTVAGQTETVDFTGVSTVEDMLNAFENAGVSVDAAISPDGSGLTIASRVIGKEFAIGESAGTLAGDLGLRTYDSATRLDDLNDGLGVPRSPGANPGTYVRDLSLTRRDGSEVTIDLGSAETIQDVLDAINAVDAGVLTATLSVTGNGLSLQDTSGAGTLSVEPDAISLALGIAGDQANAAATLDGTDTSGRKANGPFGLLVQLRDAISNNDLQRINRVSEALDDEISRFAAVRGRVASRQKVLSDTQQRIENEQFRIAETLSDTFDADIAEVITNLSSVQASYEATLAVSSRILNLNLLSLI